MTIVDPDRVVYLGNPFLTKWDYRFVKLAEEVSTWSKDPKRKVGCILTQGKRDISKGYNGFPESLPDDLVRLNNTDLKNRLTVHAEANAIINASKFGIATEGCTAYINRHPCTNCACQLIQAGVRKVICPSPDFNSPRWAEDFKLSSDILFEANILVLYYHSIHDHR